jgi:hypothetical protein
MSQELAQDEAEADAEDYEIGALERGGDERVSHQPLPQDEDEGLYYSNGEHANHEEEERKGMLGGKIKKDEDEEEPGLPGDRDVVFSMGDDSDEEDNTGADGGGEEGGVEPDGADKDKLDRGKVD